MEIKHTYKKKMKINIKQIIDIYSFIFISSYHNNINAKIK